MIRCSFCSQRVPLTLVIRRSLYKKYSMSLDYHLVRDVDELLEDTTTPNTIRYHDIIDYHSEEECLTEIYHAKKLYKKLKRLLKNKRQAFPRIFSLPEYLLLSENHARHDRLLGLAHLPRTDLLGIASQLDCEYQDCSRTTIDFLKQIINGIFKERVPQPSQRMIHFDGTFPVEGGWTPEISGIQIQQPHRPAPSLQTALMQAFKKKTKAQVKTKKKTKQISKKKTSKFSRPKRSSADPARPPSAERDDKLQQNLTQLKQKIRAMKIKQLRKANQQSSVNSAQIKHFMTREEPTVIQGRMLSSNPRYKLGKGNILQTVPDLKESKSIKRKKTHIRTNSDQNLVRPGPQVKRMGKHKFTQSNEALPQARRRTKRDQ